MFIISQVKKSLIHFYLTYQLPLKSGKKAVERAKTAEMIKAADASKAIV